MTFPAFTILLPGRNPQIMLVLCVQCFFVVARVSMAFLWLNTYTKAGQVFMGDVRGSALGGNCCGCIAVKPPSGKIVFFVRAGVLVEETMNLKSC